MGPPTGEGPVGALPGHGGLCGPGSSWHGGVDTQGLALGPLQLVQKLFVVSVCAS